MIASKTRNFIDLLVVAAHVHGLTTITTTNNEEETRPSHKEEQVRKGREEVRKER